MKLKTLLEKRLNRYQLDKKRWENEFNQTKEELELCERLLNRAEKGMIKKDETQLSAEETESLPYEVMALKDIQVWERSRIEDVDSEIHLTHAKLDALAP